jgi:phosphohistidine phosphatase
MKMKTLLLLRHAKSSWNNPVLRDFDRPLNERGLKAAPLIGSLLRERRLQPSLILSSPAERARQTTALVSQAAQLNVEPRFDEHIYEASALALLEVVSQIEDEVEQAMLVGHNPGMEELLMTLTGEARRMPTAALALIRLDVKKWSEVREGTGHLEWLVKPKELARD